MKTPKRNVIFITGTSSGIGRSCADFLSKAGYTVYGTSRKKIMDPSPPYETLEMDVSIQSSIQGAVDYILSKEKRIDVVINNAGIGISGSVEDGSADEIMLQMDTNFFGLIRVCKTVLPILRKQRSGLIINISSVGGIAGLPFQGYYCASKFAMEGISEALRYELKEFNIGVVIVEPGDMRTGFTGSRIISSGAGESSAYHTQFARTLDKIVDDENHGADPLKVARCIHNIINSRSPRFRYVPAKFSQRLVPLLKKILPSALFFYIIENHYRILTKPPVSHY